MASSSSACGRSRPARVAAGGGAAVHTAERRRRRRGRRVALPQRLRAQASPGSRYSGATPKLMPQARDARVRDEVHGVPCVTPAGGRRIDKADAWRACGSTIVEIERREGTQTPEDLRLLLRHARRRLRHAPRSDEVHAFGDSPAR